MVTFPLVTMRGSTKALTSLTQRISPLHVGWSTVNKQIIADVLENQ